MERAGFLERVLQQQEPWDILVIGGGATGMGICVDAASRGYSVVLLEQSDLGKGTSSRSTKLVHRGVRYLQQGNISLVVEALKERGILSQNAPHLVQNLPFVVPNYQWWEGPFYGVGLKVYDFLAGRYGFGASLPLSREEVLARIPTLQPQGLRGGVLYYDGQFDDSRLLINLAQTAAEQGACILNYARVVRLAKGAEGRICGAVFRDEETGEEHAIRARCVINAAGPFCDSVRQLDDPAAEPLVTPSQGVHIVLDRSFLPGHTAIMVPHTPDRRVMFALPWHGHTIVGTTDTPIASVTLEPRPVQGEIELILQAAGNYLARRPERADILSVFTGIRPLFSRPHAGRTARLSREHSISVAPSGLVTIVGGKWTTYRKMAADCVDVAILVGTLPKRACVTRGLRIHGTDSMVKPPRPDSLAGYGADAAGIAELMRLEPALAQALHPALPITGAEILWAARHEMARTVEDALARRTRALFLNARVAAAMAPSTARLLARELGRGEEWQQAQVEDFQTTAKAFLPL